MKLTLPEVERIIRADATDSAKVTTLLSFFETDKEQLSLLRGLSPEQIKTHLLATGKKEVDPNQAEENVNLTLYSMVALYAQKHREKFGTWVDQPNIRTVIRLGIQRHGTKKLQALLESFLHQARNVEEAKLSRFYALHVQPPKKQAKS